MKNTLSITSNCICSCVDNIADGTNRIFIVLNVGNVVNPQFKVWLNDNLKNETDLIANELNIIELDIQLFEPNGKITFQYLDSSYTGKVFTISFPDNISGNLFVSKTSDYVFTAKYTQNSGGSGYVLPVMTKDKLGGAKVGSNLGITADAHLFAEVTPTEAITNLEIDAICN